jgi:ATP-dependent helicase/nuclease subunit A
LEIARLLYVACTRAERELHLFGEVNKNGQPASSSLLARLWTDDDLCFGAQVNTHEPTAENIKTKQALTPNIIQRLSPSFSAPDPQSSIPGDQTFDETTKMVLKPEFSWAGASAKAIGIALHAALQHIAESGFESWQSAETEKTTSLMRAILYQEGISQAYLDKTLARCQKGLNNCFNSTRAQWILSQKHQEQHNEWALTYVAQGICKHMVLDRSFIDKEGTRWIIDYKTGSHHSSDIDAFLDQELIRYTEDTPQLPNYVKVLKALEPKRNIKAALYFPMVDGWRVWQDV